MFSCQTWAVHSVAGRRLLKKSTGRGAGAAPAGSWGPQNRDRAALTELSGKPVSGRAVGKELEKP